MESLDLPNAPRAPPPSPFNTRALAPFPFPPPTPAAPAPPPAPAAAAAAAATLALDLALTPAALDAIARNPVDPVAGCCLGREVTPFPSFKVIRGTAALSPDPAEPSPGDRPEEAPLAPGGSPFPLPPPPLPPPPPDNERFFPMIILPIPLELSPPVELLPTRIFFLEGPVTVIIPGDPEAVPGVGEAVPAAPPVPPGAVPAAGAPRLLKAVSPCRCRFNRSKRIYKK